MNVDGEISDERIKHVLQFELVEDCQDEDDNHDDSLRSSARGNEEYSKETDFGKVQACKGLINCFGECETTGIGNEAVDKEEIIEVSEVKESERNDDEQHD